jgi:hypothetical protein
VLGILANREVLVGLHAFDPELRIEQLAKHRNDCIHQSLVDDEDTLMHIAIVAEIARLDGCKIIERNGAPLVP